MNNYHDSTLRADLTRTVETKMAHIHKEQLQTMTFPMLLMKILADENNSTAASWLPHGLSFRIHDRPAFLELLTEYERCFMPGKGSSSAPAGTGTKKSPSRTIKWTSLTRKLCRWNILRMTAGPDCGAFCHPNLQRDYPELAKDMVIGSDGTSVADVLQARSQQPVVPVAPVMTTAATQFAEAKAKMQAQAQAQARQQLAQQSLQMPAQQQQPSLFQLQPSAPLMAASHLPALVRLQELVRQSKLAAIRAAPNLGFDAKIIEAELNAQQQQQSALSTAEVATPTIEAPAPSQAAAIRAAAAQSAAQSITQSIIASAPTTASPLGLSIQREEERIRLLANQIRLGQQRQRQLEAAAGAMAAAARVTGTAKADASVLKTDMAGEVTHKQLSNAQA